VALFVRILLFSNNGKVSVGTAQALKNNLLI